MLKNVLIVTAIAGSSVLNEYIKRNISETKIFKSTMIYIKKQLQQLNINISYHIQQQNQQKQQQQIQSNNKPHRPLPQQQQIFAILLTPKFQLLLQKKSKTRLQHINKLKNNQNFKTNLYLTGIHSFGTLINTRYFYWSAICYCIFSQINMIHDVYVIKTGNKVINLPFQTLGELYLKLSVVALGVLGLRTFGRVLKKVGETKQIVRKDQ